MIYRDGVNDRELSLQDIQDNVGPGWAPLIAHLVTDLEGLGWDGRVDCVKEKFGGLRFYVPTGSTEIWNRLDQAEYESKQICEQCGKPGKIVKPNGWLKTLCPECEGGRL